MEAVIDGKAISVLGLVSFGVLSIDDGLVAGVDGATVQGRADAAESRKRCSVGATYRVSRSSGRRAIVYMALHGMALLISAVVRLRRPDALENGKGIA